MKKSICTAAALASLSVTAHAQGSVTLYGLIDGSVAYTTNQGGGKTWAMGSGATRGSRVGFVGSEDLGGGTRAIFRLENGFDVTDGSLGQGGLMFGRQAYVGLSSSYGMVTLGRQYDSVVDYTGALEVGSQWGSFYAAHPGDLDNLNNTNRVNNAIKYTSKNLSGETFGGLYSLGGVAGNFTTNSPAR